MEEGYTLEEVFEEDAIQDIRRGLWEKAPEDLREDVYDDFPMCRRHSGLRNGFQHPGGAGEKTKEDDRIMRDFIQRPSPIT